MVSTVINKENLSLFSRPTNEMCESQGNVSKSNKLPNSHTKIAMGMKKHRNRTQNRRSASLKQRNREFERLEPHN